MRKIIVFIIVCILYLTGCSGIQVIDLSVKSKHKNSIMQSTFNRFDKTMSKYLELNIDDEVIIEYQVKVESGDFAIVFEDHDTKEVLWELNENEEGIATIIIPKKGSYNLRLTGEEAKGFYRIDLKIK